MSIFFLNRRYVCSDSGVFVVVFVARCLCMSMWRDIYYCISLSGCGDYTGVLSARRDRDRFCGSVLRPVLWRYCDNGERHCLCVSFRTSLTAGERSSPANHCITTSGNLTRVRARADARMLARARVCGTPQSNYARGIEELMEVSSANGGSA